MTRPILDQSAIHPAVLEIVNESHKRIVEDVKSAIASNAIVIVGMAQNPFPKRARKALDALSQPYKYMEYGSYFKQWKERGALKMWSGWQTFPMIFVKGSLVGGADDLQRLITSGELKTLLSAERR
jgi:monothiol glutaredoxin